jgi:DnaJ homolog subfamily B member 12
LSDPQKRTIYDRYGEEDPDNRGGSAAGAGGMHMRHGGQEMSPEDIFNAFFGGGIPGGGGPGLHFYSTGFGPGGVQFRTGGGPRRQQQQRGQQQQQPADNHGGFGMLLQMLPIFLFIILSFLSQDNTSSSSSGEGQYFSLVVRILIWSK